MTDVKTAPAPKPGLYPQDDGTVVLVRTSKKTGNWYAVGLRRRPDYTLERTYLGHHTDGLHSPVSVEDATEHLVGVRL